MPRNRRGGSRQGTPGKAYPNRSDLSAAKPVQPVRVASGQQYGQAGAQAAAQRAVPLPAGGGVPAPSAVPSAAPGGPAPGDLGPLDRDTDRPGEPVTAGAPLGAGPGTEALGGMVAPDNTTEMLRAIYSRFPSDDLRALLEELDTP